VNPAEWLHRTARRFPDNPALLLGGVTLADYAAFDRNAALLGAGLAARGLGPGDRVALFLPNCPEYLTLMAAIWYCGAAAVPINGKLHPREVAWIAGNAGVKLIFTADGEAICEGWEGAPDRPAPDCLAPGSDALIALAAHAPLPAPCPLGADDPAWIFYTSGTTGRPKGAVLTCGNLMTTSLTYLADVDDVAAADAALYAAPMSHGAGLYSLVHILRGARHIVPESGRFDPAEILELAARHGPISMFAAPTMVKRLVAAARAAGSDGPGIKTIVYGGGPMYVADIKEALAVMGPKFVQIYGQGESPMCISALSRAEIADSAHPDWDTRLASVGRAQSSVSLRVVDSEDRDVAPGELGEILVRGPSVMAGHHANPEATARTLRGGWLHTGDIGRLDANGYLTLQDRAGDVVISGGTNIYPREVEEVLLRVPQVREVAIVGTPDPEWGEVAVAFVVPEGDAPDCAALDAACRAELARFKTPKRYVFVDDLPKNNYGKVLKTALRARLEADAPREGA